jgi:hypothetical protein
MKVGLWSTTAGSNNSTPPDGWPEGQAPSTVNDCAREMMAAIRTALQDIDFFDHGLSPTFINANSFSVPTDQTSRLMGGRKLKLFDAATIYRAIQTATFTAVTTIQLESGSAITASLSSFAIGVINPINSAIPGQGDGAFTASAIIANAVTVNNTLSVSGATALNGALSVGGAAVLGTTLTVSGATVLKGALSVGGAVDIAGAATLGSTLTVSAATVLLGALSVGGAVTFGTTLSVSGATVLKGALSVGGAVTLGTTLSVSGAATVGTTLSVSGAAVLKGALSVGGATTLAGTLSVGGTAVAGNIAKAWAVGTFTFAGAVITTAFNVASASRSATGVMRLTFTNALVDANYAPIISPSTNAGAGNVATITPLAGSIKFTVTESISNNPSDSFSYAIVIYR